jgi:hypothetical protein
MALVAALLSCTACTSYQVRQSSLVPAPVLHEAARVQLTSGVQNHPTNQELFASSSPDAEVNAGPLYVIAGLGVEWEPLPYLGVAPIVQWPLTRSPIDYGPIVGLGLRGMLPRSEYAR